jgi:hypothetical protein
VNIEDVIRRRESGPYKRKPIPVRCTLPLPAPVEALCSFDDVLEYRRSADTFRPPSLTELSVFLYGLAAIRSVDRKDPNRQKRPVASMGALHPAHIILHVPSAGWVVYLPDQHCLGELCVCEQSSQQLLQLAEEHMPGHDGTIICLISDCDLAANYYEHYEPLLYRDAGVLLGHAALVAAAYRLAFRILGRTGTQAAETLVNEIPFTPLATGLALVGSRQTDGLAQTFPTIG